jgi:hypothetical protein
VSLRSGSLLKSESQSECNDQENRDTLVFDLLPKASNPTFLHLEKLLPEVIGKGVLLDAGQQSGKRNCPEAGFATTLSNFGVQLVTFLNALDVGLTQKWG